MQKHAIKTYPNSESSSSSSIMHNLTPSPIPSTNNPTSSSVPPPTPSTNNPTSSSVPPPTPSTNNPTASSVPPPTPPIEPPPWANLTQTQFEDYIKKLKTSSEFKEIASNKTYLMALPQLQFDFFDTQHQKMIKDEGEREAKRILDAPPQPVKRKDCKGGAQLAGTLIGGGMGASIKTIGCKAGTKWGLTKVAGACANMNPWVAGATLAVVGYFAVSCMFSDEASSSTTSKTSTPNVKPI